MRRTALLTWGIIVFLAFGCAGAAYWAWNMALGPHLHMANGRPGALALIVEPDDGTAPVVAMIQNAGHSIDLVIYELDDGPLEAALVAAERRGVAVRVLLGSGYDGASSTFNRTAYNYLQAQGVPVQWSPAYFALTHQKTLVADGARALIMTFNLVAKYYPTGRDFGIADDDPTDVAAIERTFESDWEGSGPGDSGNRGDGGDDLLWSPGSKQVLLDLIGNARRTLLIYNEEMADRDITKALIDAARRGVAVYVVMTGSAQWKWEFAELVTAGARVRTYADDPAAPLYIHAKMVIADGERAFVGSENFSEASLLKNRELGIVTDDAGIIKSLTNTFVRDFRGASAFAMP